jgi:hypothetical protein
MKGIPGWLKVSVAQSSNDNLAALDSDCLGDGKADPTVEHRPVLGDEVRLHE